MTSMSFANTTVIRDDCLTVVRQLPDSCIDSIVTDPPYHLTSIVKRFGGPNAAPARIGQTGAYERASRGFMGQQWDGGNIAFDPMTWSQMLRVLKPGGHMVAFSATRNYHRMTCAIEDAGFVVRDQLAWVYGCLSDDTEILTRHGWKLGVDVIKGEDVAAWCAKTGRIELLPVEDRTLAPYCGDLVRFLNDDTDQLLTPNHRVYCRKSKRQMRNGFRVRWYDDEYEVHQAGAINRWNPIKLPLAGLHDGEGIGGTDYAALLGWVWTEGGFDKAPSTGVRIYQSESANAIKVDEIQSLFDRIVSNFKRYDREREYIYGGKSRIVSETCWFFTGELARRVRSDLPNKFPSWDLLWRMSIAEKRAFFDAAMKGDGSGDDFYQKDKDSLIWFQTLCAMIGSRGKISMRNAPRDGGSVCVTKRNTTELQTRHLRVAKQNYKGNVWCVKVATGAFVARRNGKVFITGNSGFPKSHDQGNGWGTALKPAWEPICLAQKPFKGTIANNVSQWGTGAINIDACRIEGRKAQVTQWINSRATSFNVAREKRLSGPPDEGRWPANLCHDGSDEVLQCFPRAPGQQSASLTDGTKTTKVYGVMTRESKAMRPRIDSDKSAVRFFYCAKASGSDRGEGNTHPTVKPTALMEWLCKLITPPNGIILDPFLGSGSTGKAAHNAGFAFIGIERDPAYFDIALARLWTHAQNA